jgi:two-component system LytT family response regulator
VSDDTSLGVVRAIICEDEPLAIKALRGHLRSVEWIRIVGEARTGPDAVRLIQKEEPDLVFLDVRMPGASGLQVLDAITHAPAIVFTTAFDDYAIPAFDAGAVDYLVKPFGRERLLRTVDRVRVRLLGEGLATRDGTLGGDRAPYAKRLFARHREGIVPVPVSEIVRVDAAPGGTSVVTMRGTFALDVTIGELESRLPPGDFIRVHRSHIIHLAHVTSMQAYDERRLILRMADGSDLIASRQGSRALRGLME